MTIIYKLKESTSLILCDSCLDELGPVPGTWEENPLADCSVCGEVDLRSREEMDAFHHNMTNLQWEDEQAEPDYNPQELK